MNIRLRDGRFLAIWKTILVSFVWFIENEDANFSSCSLLLAYEERQNLDGSSFVSLFTKRKSTKDILPAIIILKVGGGLLKKRKKRKTRKEREPEL